MNLLQKCFVITGIAALATYALAIPEADTVEGRLKPVGELCMAGEACAATAVTSSIGGEPRAGDAIYSSACQTCHATGAAGAPKMGDTAAWQPRLDERGLDTLKQNAWDGYNAMPAKGLCMDCSREEMDMAVEHIIDSST